MKITKKQYDDYSQMSDATNSINRTLADLHAHVEFLQRTQNVDELLGLNERLTSFLISVKVEFKNTLCDELEK